MRRPGRGAAPVRPARSRRAWLVGLCGVTVLALGAGLLASAFGVPAPAAPVPPADRAPDLPASGPGAGDGTEIVVLGTSLTSRSQWPDDVAEGVSRCRGGAGVTVVAAAGQGSAWAVQQVDRIVDADPDVVLVELAVNDAALHRGVPLSRSRAIHERLLDDLDARLPQARVVLVTTNPVHGLRGAARPGLGSYYDMYRRLALARDLGLVDLHARWLAGQAGPLRTALPDGLHPSAQADRDVTAPEVTAVLCSG